MHPRRFYNPVTSLLGPSDGTAWRKMKSVGELRRERAEPVPVAKDSLYRPIERRPRKFNPLRVPKALHKALPFASKPKDDRPRRAPTYETKRAVVMEPAERRLHTLMQRIGAIRNDKTAKRKEAQVPPWLSLLRG